MASHLDPIFDAFTQLRAKWPKRGWSWDSRLNCVASSFDASVADEAHSVLSQALPTVWAESTMPKASSVLREIGERSGGVRAGQLIYASDPIASVQPYGLWWPWGNGQTISLRVGLDAATDFNAKLHELFGTEP